MPQIRNAAVAKGRLTAAGQFLVYTVPTGSVLLLKAVQLLNAPGPAQNVLVFQYDPGLTVQIYLFNGSVPTNTPETISTWVALNQGDQIFVNPGAAQVFYWISGALLPTQVQFSGTTATPATATTSATPTQIESLPLPPGTRGEPTPILLPPPAGIVSPA